MGFKTGFVFELLTMLFDLVVVVVAVVVVVVVAIAGLSVFFLDNDSPKPGVALASSARHSMSRLPQKAPWRPCTFESIPEKVGNTLAILFTTFDSLTKDIIAVDDEVDETLSSGKGRNKSPSWRR